MAISLGYRFQPYDYELLMHLLFFVTGRKLHNAGLIRQEDLFGDKPPWELFRWDLRHHKFQYFFTQLKRKATKCRGEGLRFERTVGKTGTWHGQDKGKPVFDKEGRAVLGYKRSFVYKSKSNQERDEDGQWLLKEFYLSDELIQKGREKEKYPILKERKDFVLCRLQRKKRADLGQESNNFEDVPVETILQILEGEILPPPQPIISSQSPTTPLQDDMGSIFDGIPMENIVAEPVRFQAPIQDRDAAAAADMCISLEEIMEYDKEFGEYLITP